jgi:cephalosporin-C deacetylase
MDPICPPSTVKAGFNHHKGEDRTMAVWPFADLGGGHGSTPPVQLASLRERSLTRAPHLAWTAGLRCS